MTKKKLPIAEQQVIEDRLNVTREKLKIVQNEPYIEYWKNLSIENIEGEVWKDVEGWSGVYQISNYCRLKSLARITKQNKKMENLILTQIVDNSHGYRFINFRSPNFKKYPHRLIAEAFIPNPLNLPCINHINGNKQDCRIINLEWCSKSHNALHATKILNKSWVNKKKKISTYNEL